jgi:oligosaccharyltransferase complex subunit alpha (ribophorin I)
MSPISPLSLLLFLLVLFSSSVYASIPQVFRHANLLRTIDLTKPYVRDSTAVVVENISNTTQTEYLWGIPLSLATKMSYLEVKEKKSGVSPTFAVEKAVEEHAYRYV